jgi:hypothetical protein
MIYDLINGLSPSVLGHLLAVAQSLSDNAANANPGQLGAVGTVVGSAMWGAVQNRLPITPPTVAGPGIIDTGQYLSDIARAGSPEAANRAAAKGIYDNLLPGLGDTMNPMVKSMLDLGKK